MMTRNIQHWDAESVLFAELVEFGRNNALMVYPFYHPVKSYPAQIAPSTLVPSSATSKQINSVLNLSFPKHRQNRMRNRNT
jgi:hypothetical protein